jgi:hypothetical protein
VTLLSRGVVFALVGCGEPAENHGPGEPPGTTVVPPPTSPPVTPPEEDVCEPGSVAVAKSVTLAVLGRRPLSRDEVDASVAVLDTEGAEALVQELAAEPEYLVRWTELVMDHLRVQRNDLQSQIDCYGKSRREPDGGALAAHVRDHEADTPGDGAGGFTARDLLRSSLELDNVLPGLRGHLFAMMEVPVRSCNVYSGVVAELNRRAEFGQWFDATYLNRDADCLACHNSEFAVTWSADPAINRHWPMAGLFEKALFGVSNDMSPDEAHAILRFDGLKYCNFPNVCTEYPGGPGARTPWGWSAEDCGDFYLDDLPPDATGISAKFGTLSGEATVYDVDRILQRGADALATDGLVMDSVGNIEDPDAAFAYLAAASFVEFVWEEVVGTELTIANRFPRNQASRDQLAALTDSFVASGWSLRSLLAEIVASPWFQPPPPAMGCGETAYTLAAVYDPWTTSELDAGMRLNSGADSVQPLSARTILSAAYAALGQSSTIDTFFVGGPFAPELLTEKDRLDTEFLSGIGAYLNHGATGFRGLDFQARLLWEERFGGCPAVAQPDYVDGLVDRAMAEPTATVRDVVLAMKDRFLAEPVVDTVAPDEGMLLEGLFGTPLDTPVASVPDLEDRTRRYCGVLLSSPQFLLGGLATDEIAATPKLNVLVE